MRLVRVYVLILIVSFFCAVAMSGEHHGPRGFNNYKYQNINGISEIYKHCHDKEKITLRGRLTRYFGDDDYEFTDNFGDTIEVELDDDKDWSYLAKDELIEIFGKVDRDDFKIKIDVKDAKKVLNQAPNTLINP